VKSGAIIPLNNPNNNVSEIDNSKRIIEFYPDGNSTFIWYDDDGRTEAYRLGASATTLIESTVNADKVSLHIAPTAGNFDGMVKEASTTFIVNTTQQPKKITARIGKKEDKA
jgi:alpha-glucosidase (family GH31 glycosyl hydrolase)